MGESTGHDWTRDSWGLGDDTIRRAALSGYGPRWECGSVCVCGLASKLHLVAPATQLLHTR